jgi:hypothetical protein
MVDQIFDAQYQSGRKSLNDGIDRGLSSLRTFVMSAFEALNRSQFTGPWNKPRRHKAR